MPGSSDAQVLERASAEGRLLLTFDKDFGELAFHAGLPSPCGILLFRVEPRDPVFIASFTVSVVESREDWAGHFGVVEMGRVRLAPLPARRR